MARAQLVGCGCCGALAGEELVRRGWAVRGTSRRPERLAEVSARGLEAAPADPDRVGSIADLLGDVTVLAWLLGSADGAPEQVAALHSERLRSLLRALVDSPVRGVVYEAVGEVDAASLARGRAAIAEASASWHLPTRVVEVGREDPELWSRAVADAVEDVVS